MVIASVVEETHGVLRYQIVQTAPAALTIRFDEFLHAQGAAAVTVNLAAEPPQPNPATANSHTWSGRCRQHRRRQPKALDEGRGCCAQFTIVRAEPVVATPVLRVRDDLRP